jgi:hypothetical protein
MSPLAADLLTSDGPVARCVESFQDETDTGIRMICDPRVMPHGYDRVFLASLPAMSVTQDVTEVSSFLNLCEQRDECARH